MAFFAEYGLFLAKTATIIVGILIILSMLFSLKAKTKADADGMLTIKHRNKKYDEMSAIMHEQIETKAESKARKKKLKENKKDKAQTKKKIFVIRFDGDLKASAVDDLREIITAVLLTATTDDEVLLCLESAGGVVHGYGLAASQLQRLRDANISLTVAIDKVAASGGYMMACVGSNIIAAPFAIIGSIGVIAQLPNFHRLLEKNNIDFEQITAGEYKRTLTVFGKNTKEGREKLQSEINETHELFKTFVRTHRPQINIDEVATGEHWFAIQCVEKKLVDSLQTSDQYLLTKKESHHIYDLDFKIKQSLAKKLNFLARSLFQHTPLH